MVEEQVNDDSSHYEISLTPTQAFIAFVLLLLSLAASFAFGIVIGKGDIDERLVVRREPTVVTEGNTAGSAKSRIVELGVPEKPATDTATTANLTDTALPADGTAGATPDTAADGVPAPGATRPADGGAAAPAAPAPAAGSAQAVPYFAQILSSSDAKAAESLAAKLIENGFTTAYVERTTGEKGMIYRVRVKFSSEAEARAAVDRLKPYSTGEIWVTKQ